LYTIGRICNRCTRCVAMATTQTRNVNEYMLVLALCLLITFRVSRRRREMYCGHARLSVSVSVCLSAAACPHYCTDPDVTWGSRRGCPLVVHYWADLQSVHGLRCYGNITRTRNVSEYMLVLSVCLSVCNVGVLWPNGRTDQDETWHAGRPRPWTHCVR